MQWNVFIRRKLVKQIYKLPSNVQAAVEVLIEELSESGPERISWPNYGRLQGKKDCFHCHLNKGKTRYVAVWKIVDRSIQLLEVRYVGTHEKADYRRLC